jgi:preprotein translocase subunit SecE
MARQALEQREQSQGILARAEGAKVRSSNSEGSVMAKAALATSEERSGSPQKSTANTPNQVVAFWERTANFLKDVRGEMRKVVTPSRAEVQSTTTVVIVTVFVFAAFFYVIDSVLGAALKWLLHWLGGA